MPLLQPGMPGRSRRRPDITLPLSQRDFAVPLTPSSMSSSGSLSRQTSGSPTSVGSAPPTPPPLQQPGMPGRSRWRPDLTLTLPLRDLTSLAVALTPSSMSSLGSLSRPTSTSPTSAGGSAPPTPPPPLCELERVRRVGSGAGATVWLVRHRHTGRSYALKVLYGKHDDAVRRQIARAVAVLRAAEHPSVVRCHGMYERDGELQILLDYMDGGSLDGRRIANERFLAPLARQVLSGIAYLHRRRIVHRDIKPSKLLIDSCRRVKVADFGVGRVLNLTMHPCNSSVGSMAYVSPERINTDLNDGAYDGYAGDVWSFGLTILELYLGQYPLGAKQGDFAALMRAICYSDSPQAPRDASPEFKDFISLCLQKNPANRPTAIRLLQHPFVALPEPEPQPQPQLDMRGTNDTVHQHPFVALPQPQLHIRVTNDTVHSPTLHDDTVHSPILHEQPLIKIYIYPPAHATN